MLKRLELQGFKSFAEKTSLEFPSRITAIVGPNGSGKSNVVDAIRWVLGEQSLKNIRLAKYEDVIFSGTASVARAGFAAVSLVFDNAKKLFPEELAEIVVTRRLYRDGTSNYLLNREDVRLKDIVRLMAAGKLGTRGIGIITQGAGDAFLEAPPKERREMLEEVLGLKEYRLKKEEAERKMEETKLNLEKAASLLGELLPHVRSLKRQVARWEKRKEKEEALAALQEQYFHWKLIRLEEGSSAVADRGAIEKEAAAIEKEIADLERSAKTAEENLTRVRESGAGARVNFETLSKTRSELLRAIGHLEGKLEAIGVRGDAREAYPPAEKLVSLLKHIQAELAGIADLPDIERMRGRIKEVLLRIERIWGESGAKARGADEGEALKKEREALAAKLAGIESELGAIEGEADRSRRALDESHEAMRGVLVALEGKRRALAEKRSLMQEYRFETEKRRLQEEDLAAKMSEAGMELSSFRESHAGRPAPDIGNPIEAEGKIFRLRRELAEIGSVDEELVHEYRDADSRREFLEKEKTDLERALEDLTALSAELEKKISREFSKALEHIAAEFPQYFRLLFGGGSAKVREVKPKIRAAAAVPEAPIENGTPKPEEHPEEEEGGVLIEVVPPRKKIKSLDMLSGGERALTAIAFIFAVVNVSNPPFLILDEIDAPLDESNSERFGRLLKDLSSRTQFILITHNRVTMEAADVLYGVTMQDGVSKLFSLKFEEAKDLARRDVHRGGT